MGSVAEAAAASLPGRGGTVVVGDGEFRSNLFPWLALEARGYRIIRVPAGRAGHTGSPLAAIDEQTALIAVSHVLSADGERTDLGGCARLPIRWARGYSPMSRSHSACSAWALPRRGRTTSPSTATNGCCARAAPRGW